MIIIIFISIKQFGFSKLIYNNYNLDSAEGKDLFCPGHW